MVRKELQEYIEKNIFPEYDLNEKGHGIDHIKDVIRKSLKFTKEDGTVNEEMAYVVASYHDIGHHIDAKNHEKVSAEILMKDQNLKKFFTEDQIKIMKEAVEDHRASSNHEPRSVYGKIVSSADRNTDIDNSIKRSLSYNRKHSPELTDDELIETVRQHLISKFGKNGYAINKIYFGKDEYKKYLENLSKLTNDKEKFYQKSKKLLKEMNI